MYTTAVPSNKSGASKTVRVWQRKPSDTSPGELTKSFYASSRLAAKISPADAAEIVSVCGAKAWQDPDAYLRGGVYTDGSRERKTAEHHTSIQDETWNKYQNSPVISNAIDTIADLAVGSSFSISSTIPELDTIIRRHVYSQENDLVYAVNGWTRQMLIDGEMFLLGVISEPGNRLADEIDDYSDMPFVQFLELPPGDFPSDSGDKCFIRSPSNPRMILAYVRKGSNGQEEWIPSWALLERPRERMKELRSVEGFQERYLKSSRVPDRKRGLFRDFGGFYRFILHWPGLSGLRYQQRSTAAARTSLEWVNRYEDAVKWRLDYLKAQASWTLVVKFSDTPEGRMMWRLWTNMTAAEKDATGLTKVLTPGSRIFAPPGMEIKIENPQLESGTEQNQDLLTHAGAGTGTPQDIFTGNVGNATYGALKATRSPFSMRIAALQDKLDHFLRFSVFRVICIVHQRFNQLPKSYPDNRVASMENGEPTFTTVNLEPWWFIDVEFPPTAIVEDESIIRQFLGSKHPGAQALGLSRNYMMRRLGITNPDVQAFQRAIEDKKYGDLDLSAPTERVREDAATGTDPERTGGE